MALGSLIWQEQRDEVTGWVPSGRTWQGLTRLHVPKAVHCYFDPLKKNDHFITKQKQLVALPKQRRARWMRSELLSSLISETHRAPRCWTPYRTNLRYLWPPGSTGDSQCDPVDCNNGSNNSKSSNSNSIEVPAVGIYQVPVICTLATVKVTGHKEPHVTSHKNDEAGYICISLYGNWVLKRLGDLTEVRELEWWPGNFSPGWWSPSLY